MNWKNTIEQSKPQALWFTAHQCMLHAQQWVHDESLSIVMIHGSLANHAWWQPIAASLQKGIVLSIDLSGHGLSEWDQAYSLEKHATEVCELVKEFAKGDVVLIGHSYGGIVASYAATKMDVKEVVLVDTPLHFSDITLSIKPKKTIYATKKEAMAHFRSLPPQPVSDPELLAWVAKQSIQAVEGGYTWQFDPKTLGRVITKENIEAIKTRLMKGAHWWYGEHSPFATDDANNVAKALQLKTKEVKGAYHAVMLDAPEILTQYIKQIIGDET